MSDAFVVGRRSASSRSLTTLPANGLTLVADTSGAASALVRELDAMIAWRDRPSCASPLGTEVTGMAIRRWCHEMRIEWHYIALGKRIQNAFIESFN